MLLAGDVGGTKTLLGLYAGGLPAPQPHVVRRFPTLEFGGLGELVTAFPRQRRLERTAGGGLLRRRRPGARPGLPADERPVARRRGPRRR